MDVIFDIAGAAEYLHIKKWTLYRLAKKGKVPGIKVGGQWRFKKDVLDSMFYGGSQKQKKRHQPTDD
ncbi:MAG: helix-turn-helix domain-containing protein [bacterium]|jgi:excisionase family DNA binding protein